MNPIDFLLHFDQHLLEFVRDYGAWVYGILFVIIFVETGCVVWPFLPGDSVAIPVPPLPGALVGRLMLHALGGPIFALRGTGQVMGPAGVLATVRVELLVRLNPAGPDSLMYPRAITRGWRRIP